MDFKLSFLSIVDFMKINRAEPKCPSQSMSKWLNRMVNFLEKCYASETSMFMYVYA